MKHLLFAILATLIAGSAVGLVAVPPSAPVPPSFKPEPPVPPPQPPANPQPSPAPVPPGPSIPTKPADKRCVLDKPHRAHEWTDKTGQVFRCDGGMPAQPR